MDEPMPDGWNYCTYGNPPGEGDQRKIVTLEQDGMTWVGVRIYQSQQRRWSSNGEPERAKVTAWRDLPQPATEFGITPDNMQERLNEIAKEVLGGNEPPDDTTKCGFKYTGGKP